jgi:ppGpp synthetase/RelA/SpoT-type nucleotidyltranferase
LWTAIKHDLASKINNKRPETVKDGMVLQKVILEYSKRDYYLLNSNLEQLAKQTDQLQTRLDHIESLINTLSINIALISSSKERF